MTDESAFLRTILENTGEIHPRLVFADWLEERGADPERVEFIRDAKPDIRPWRSRAAQWRKRWLRQSIASFPKSYQIWMGSKDILHRLFVGVNIGGSLRDSFVFVRNGFIEKISINQWAFIKCAKGLFSAHPVRSVILTHQDPSWPDWLVATSNGDRIEHCWMRFGERNDLRIGSMPGPGVVGPIWDKIDVQQWISTGNRRFAPFASRVEAYAALSTACVAWGRSLAGLPALEVAA